MIVRWRYIFPFAIIVGLLAVGVLSADTWLRWAFEKAGTQGNEAKVEIEKVHITYFPLSLRIQGIQVANSDHPMRNMVEIDTVQVVLNTRALVEKKVIIESSQITGISLNTPRKTSGTVPGLKPTGPSEMSKEIRAGMTQQLSQFQSLVPNLDLPKVQDLQTTKTYEKSKADLDAMSKKWTDTIQHNPFEKELQSLSQELAHPDPLKVPGMINRINALTQKWNQLNADVQKDMTTAGQIPQALQNASDTDLKTALAPLSTDKLKKLHLNTSVLSGPIQKKLLPWLEKVHTAMYYKQKFASPNPPRFHGRDPGVTILFDTPKHYPKFWLKSLLISGTGKNGEALTGQVQNITTDQSLIGEPLRVALDGQHLFHSSTHFSLLLTQTSLASIKRYHLETSLSEVPMDPFLPQAKPHTWALTHGITSVATQLTYTQGRLESLTTAQATQLRFQGPALTGPWDLNGVLVDVLQNIPRFELQLGVNGPLKHPDITVKSNVDQALAEAMAKASAHQLDKARTELQHQIDTYKAQKQAELQKLIDAQKAQLTTWIDQQQAQIKALQTQLEKQKSQVEKQAQTEINKAQKEAEKQAGDALKSMFKF